MGLYGLQRKVFCPVTGPEGEGQDPFQNYIASTLPIFGIEHSKWQWKFWMSNTDKFSVKPP